MAASKDSLMVRSSKVAVIGAGAAGLVAARELRREGHRVVVFEKGDRLGGTWVYDPRVDSDPLGVDPGRETVHSSLYRSLRTNLPRQIMGFLDYPFLKREEGDPRSFPGHEEVLSFLNDFARDFGLVELIRFCTEVVRVEQVDGRKDEWIVKTRSRGGSEMEEQEVFEAVVVCNGHNTVPRIAEIPGIERWSGEKMHSHNYRTPEPFRDKIVVVIGNGPSAHDISREISEVAKEVHLALRSTNLKVGKLDNRDNVCQHSMIERVYEDSKVVFHDGSLVYADIIFHCTGYKYHFPFLQTNGIVSVEDNRVGPLYKHVFPPYLAPFLSFVGIPTKVLPFMSYELQSKWIAQVLSGKVLLLSEEEMMVSVEEFYLHLREIGRPKHYTHAFDFDKGSFEYNNWLAAQVGLPPLEEWMEQLCVSTVTFILSHLDGFRDKWDEDYCIQQLHSSCRRLL